MSDRTVSYRLQAEIGAFKAQMAQASAAVKHSADQMTAATKQGASFRAGLTTLGNTAGKIGLVAAAGLGAAVLSAAKFDEAMAHVGAATHESAANMELLRDAALEAGARTVFSATEAANAIEELAKASVSTQDILGGGLNAALDLASAGTIDVAQAAEIAATTMNQFGLAGSEAGRAADVLSAAAGKAQGEVTDIALAMKYVGPVAHQMGISLEEAGGSIAYLATQGIQGEQAGTGLRGMLMSLTSPSSMAKDTMDELGISMYDAKGHFVGLDGVAGQLKASMSGLTEAERDEALGRIFGNAQVTTARILYAGGADAIHQWTRAVDDSGYASETAAMKLDSLMGDLEQLGGSLQTAFIGIGDSQQGGLRSLVQGLTDVVNVFNKLPDSAKGATASMLGVTAVLGGGTWFTAKAIVGVSEMRKALTDLGPAGTKAAAGLRAVSIIAAAGMGLDIAISALAALNRELDETAPNIFVLRSNLEDLAAGGNIRPVIDDMGDLQGAIEAVSDPTKFQAINDFYEKIPVFGSVLPSMLEIAPFSGDELRELREASTALDSLDQALAGLAASEGPKAARQAFKELADTYQLTAAEQQRLVSLLPTAQDFLQGIGGAAKEAGTGANFFGSTAQRLAGILSGLTGDTNSDTGATKSNAAAHRDAAKALSEERAQRIRNASAVINYEASIDDATKAAKENGRTLDVTTEKGRANRTALLNLASAWNDQSKAVRSNKGEQQDAIGTFVRVATQMGMNAQAARNYAEKLLDIPPKRSTQVNLDGVQQSMAELAALQARINSLHGKTIYNNVRTIGGPQAGPMADGGTVPGQRYPYADKTLILAAPGEEVITNRHGEADAFRRDRAAGRIPHYADGGTIGASRATSYLDATRADLALSTFARTVDSATRATKSNDSAQKSHEQHLKALTKAYDEQKTVVDEARSALQQLKQDANAFGESVSSNFKGDQWYQANPEIGFTAWEALSLSLENQAASASAFQQQLQTASGRGLSGGLFQYVAQSGDYSLASEIAGMSRSQIRDAEQLYRQRNQAAASVGGFAREAAFGAKLDRSNAHLQEVRDELRDLKASQKREEQIIKHLDQTGPERTGKVTGRVINGTASVGHRRRRG